MSTTSLPSVSPCAREALESDQPESRRFSDKDFDRLRRSFAVMKIAVQENDWKPRNERSAPPSILNGVENHVSAEFVRAYNASRQSTSRGNFAVLLLTGGVLILTGKNAAGRPDDPTDFPTNAETGFTAAEAGEIIAARNAEAYRLSKVPREWWIAVHSIEAALHYDEFRAAVDRKAQPPAATCEPQDEPTIPAARAGTFKKSRVALVHPHYGTIAISPRELPESDVAVILSEARPAIVRDAVAMEGGAE